MNSSDSSPISNLALSASAEALLDLLQDLEHLDEVSIGEVIAALARSPEALGVFEGHVSRAALRRAAAAALFERGDEGEAAELLKREWPLLFG
jgi:hypothetical protein